jgi:hypothetical protein
MQHKNMFTTLSLGDVFVFFKVLPRSGEPQNIFVRVVFSEKSGKMYILHSTTFVALWRVSLLCCFLMT